MPKKLNYKKIFKDIVEHKNNNIFMIDFGGEQYLKPVVQLSRF